jgi:hypothetical protein
VLRYVGSRTVAEEGIAAEAARDLRQDPGARAEDEEAVVAGVAVHLDRFDADERDVQPGAEDPALGDDEVVVELRADDDDRVEAVAAVDVDGRVDRMLDEVGAGVAGHVGALAQILLRATSAEARIREAVVAVVAEQRQRQRLW